MNLSLSLSLSLSHDFDVCRLNEFGVEGGPTVKSLGLKYHLFLKLGLGSHWDGNARC